MYPKLKRVHFVGIGGIGMSGIAEVLLNLGYVVSGSDLQKTDLTERLKRMGANLHYGHEGNKVSGADAVVISSAVSPDNIEVREARELGIPVIPRAEMLAELMRMKYSVAIAGAHGKTTTTSLVAAVLFAANFDPTVVIGGRVNQLGSNAKLGKGEFLVAEADESDGSFLRLSPTIAVVTNIDAEHLDYYHSLERVKEAFVSFVNKVPFYGQAILCGDDPGVQSILPQIKRGYVTYGFSPECRFRAMNTLFDGLTSRFDVMLDGADFAHLELRIPGKHNILNSLAALTCGWELGIPVSSMTKALYEFNGVQRRFQIKGDVRNIIVMDDYGHHPTEVSVTLETAQSSFRRRLVVLFQPHRFTRTHNHFDEFVRALQKSDLLLITDIYPAGEEPIAGVDSSSLAEAVRKAGHSHCYYETKEEMLERLKNMVRPHDVVLTLGAGDIYKVGERFLEWLNSNSPRLKD